MAEEIDKAQKEIIGAADYNQMIAYEAAKRRIPAIAQPQAYYDEENKGELVSPLKKQVAEFQKGIPDLLNNNDSAKKVLDGYFATVIALLQGGQEPKEEARKEALAKAEEAIIEAYKPKINDKNNFPNAEAEQKEKLKKLKEILDTENNKKYAEEIERIRRDMAATQERNRVAALNLGYLGYMQAAQVYPVPSDAKFSDAEKTQMQNADAYVTADNLIQLKTGFYKDVKDPKYPKSPSFYYDEKNNTVTPQDPQSPEQWSKAMDFLAAKNDTLVLHAVTLKNLEMLMNVAAGTKEGVFTKGHKGKGRFIKIDEATRDTLRKEDPEWYRALEERMNENNNEIRNQMNTAKNAILTEKEKSKKFTADALDSKEKLGTQIDKLNDLIDKLEKKKKDGKLDEKDDNTLEQIKALKEAMNEFDAQAAKLENIDDVDLARDDFDYKTRSKNLNTLSEKIKTLAEHGASRTVDTQQQNDLDNIMDQRENAQLKVANADKKMGIEPVVSVAKRSP